MIITHIENRAEFLKLLARNPGYLIIKFGATWCAPCKKIDPVVEKYFAIMEQAPEKFICCTIDIDESIDVFAFLKTKKMVSSIPTILCYDKGNCGYIPDDSIVGADEHKIAQFFDEKLN